MSRQRKLKVALVQCVCPHYRIPVFQKISKEYSFVLFYGKGERTGALKNSFCLPGFRAVRLFTLVIKFQIKGLLIRLVWFPSLLVKLYKEKPDIIITEGFTNIINNLFLLIYKSMFKTPLIVWDAGRQKDKKKSLIRKIIEPLYIKVLDKTDAVVSYGKTGKEYFTSIGIAAKKIFIAPNAINIEECKKMEGYFDVNPAITEKKCEELKLANNKLILYIGALEKRKRVGNLMKVFRNLSKEKNNIILVIIGDGPEMPNLLSLRKQLNIENNCYLLGRKIKEKYLYLYLSDLFVQPGWNSLAILEAMVFGKPVITVRHGGLEYEIIEDKKNGLIVKRDDLLQLRESVNGLLDNDDFSKKIGENARKSVQNLNIANMIEGFKKAVSFSVKK